MTSIKATDARATLYRLIDEVAESHEPVIITGRRSIQETLHLLSVPGMQESIGKV